MVNYYCIGVIRSVERMIKDAVTLSHPQKRILYTEHRYPNTNFANIPYVFWFEKAVDSKLMHQAVAWIVQKYLMRIQNMFFWHRLKLEEFLIKTILIFHY